MSGEWVLRPQGVSDSCLSSGSVWVQICGVRGSGVAQRSPRGGLKSAQSPALLNKGRAE